ncbi:hypothetical protein CRE_27215 [Caenorhabditis remanei]|uniref:BPTI/Kunitz inhibitor domain-containing protein n=1 Tax=Caenorhabditis remanei TaxID=31234 RepID=E3LP47_CAERE|nr:hypothetical protein CRE_27215 [Caenorhabditis remanei]
MSQQLKDLSVSFLIQYHFDNDTRLCMAFEFEGCESNENNFLSDSECKASCSPTDNVGCPVNSKPLTKEDGSNLCQQSEDCVPEGYCSKRLSGGGKCCRKAIREVI